MLVYVMMVDGGVGGFVSGEGVEGFASTERQLQRQGCLFLADAPVKVGRHRILILRFISFCCSFAVVARLACCMRIDCW